MKTHIVRTDDLLKMQAVIYYDPKYLWVARLENPVTEFEIETEYLGGTGKGAAIDYALRLFNRVRDEKLARMDAEDRAAYDAAGDAKTRAIFASL